MKSHTRTNSEREAAQALAKYRRFLTHTHSAKKAAAYNAAVAAIQGAAIQGGVK